MALPSLLSFRAFRSVKGNPFAALFSTSSFNAKDSQTKSKQTLRNNELICTEFSNRNPRNLEMLTIAYKPAGYGLDKPGREFWNKLKIKPSRHSVKAEIIHNSGTVVTSASSAEWGIKKQLYRYTDSSAYKAVARVLAERAKECGICHVYSDYTSEEGTKLDIFLKTLSAGGVSLDEKERYRTPNKFEKIQQTPPWENLNLM